MNEGKTVSHFSEFGKLFEGRLFQIPDYQRGYSWGKKQWQDLLEDLDQLDDDTQQHFFGTIILHAQGVAENIPSQNGQAYGRYDIVDGQQRLVTLIILLNELARALAEYDEQQAFSLREQTVFVRDAIGIPRPRVLLNLDADGFFQSNILQITVGQQRLETPTQQRLAAAQTFFAEQVAARRAEAPDAFHPWLQAEIGKVTRQLTVILYAAEQETDAALIFAAMNDRGKPITEMEKVKSYLLYAVRRLNVQSDIDLIAEINRTWKHIYSNLAAARLGDHRSEDQLLRAHWLMAYDPKPGNWRGAESIKQKFDLRRDDLQPEQLFKQILDYLETLRSAATTYCDVQKPTRDGAFAELGADKETSTRILEISKKLVRLESLATFLPLLMAVRLRYRDNALEYLETADLCEKFAFRVYRWRRWRSYTGQSRFFRLAHQLYKGRNIDALQDDIRRLIFRYCTDEQFAERFQSTTENWYDWAGLKYLLYEYEQHLADRRNLGVQMQWDTDVVRPNTIEHILPQTPDSAGYWSARFDEAEYARYRHDIGNLTLTYDNTPLSNKPFFLEVEEAQTYKGHKWSYYFNSALFMEKDLTMHRDWLPKNIETRRAKIAEWATKRWLVDPPAAATTEPDSGKRTFTLTKVRTLAEQRGVHELYDRLLGGFRQHGVRVKPWRWCVTLAPPQGKQYALGVVYPEHGYLGVGLWLGNFPRYYRGITTEDAEAILGPVDQRVDVTNIDDFLARVERLFAKIEGTT